MDNSANLVQHGLIRHPDGTLTTFDVPGAGTGSYQGTGCPSLATAQTGSHNYTLLLGSDFLCDPSDASSSGINQSQERICPQRESTL
jgi:hypothetical protein